MNSTTSSFVQLLGRAQVRRDAVQIDFQPDKRFQLLAYLAHHGDWVSREQLAYLFWADGAPDDARNNLRQLLARVRALDCAPDLEAERHRVRWLAQTDVAGFLRAINDKHWQAALELYGGSLLAGLEAEDTGEFAAWLELERQNLHSLWAEAIN